MKVDTSCCFDVHDERGGANSDRLTARSLVLEIARRWRKCTAPADSCVYTSPIAHHFQQTQSSPGSTQSLNIDWDTSSVNERVFSPAIPPQLQPKINRKISKMPPIVTYDMENIRNLKMSLEHAGARFEITQKGKKTTFVPNDSALSTLIKTHLTNSAIEFHLRRKTR